jgi:hypothetical protein
MPGSADFIQRTVHAIETGATSLWIRRSLALLTVITTAVIFLYNFRGLATSQAMDQAQIGRAIASGQGWHTNYARPLAVGQLQSHGKDVARRLWVDTYNAPLPPLVDAIALFPIKSHLMGAPTSPVYLGDRAIAILAILLFFGSVIIQFFTAERLFDRWLALLACSLTLICDTLWQYSVSGLPQMLLLFLFNATLYALVRAVEAKYQGGAVGPWLAAVGAGFGLLALTHGLTIWIFFGALIFISFFFRPRGWAAALVLSAFLVLYVPWLIRNWIVCGNPTGLSVFSVLDGLGGHGEGGWMRQVAFHAEGIGPAAMRDKILGNIVLQMGRIFEYLGWSVVAVMFFVSSLHLFKRAETSAIRWILLAMWGGAVLGMSIFGLNEEQGVSANQLHLLFIPLMTCYGLAWLLVQWNRLGIQFRLARMGFIVALFFVCGFPLITSLFSMVFGPPHISFRWPPYVPPYIGVLNKWMDPDEITASDMPWAIAWYANRRSILVPDTVKAMTDLSDYGNLGGPIAALYLTPISGMDNKLRDIKKGDYREWAAVIEQTPELGKLPFKWGTLVLGFDKECAFLSDHDRSHSSAP